MMSSDTDEQEAAERGRVTRAIEVVLDPSPSQERWLRSYVGSMRAGYNWALEQVAVDLAVRRAERGRDVPEDELTTAMSWSRESLMALWRQVRDEVHPWWRGVSIHPFRTGIDNAALALKNYSASRSGKRRGRKVGFPRFRNRHSRQAVTFVELSQGVDHRHWIRPDTREHVRLMLPQRAGQGTWERRHTRPRAQQTAGRDRRSEVAWLHTHQPDAVGEVWRLCEAGRAKVQALTIKHDGGRWRAVFRLRILDGTARLRNPGEPVKQHGGVIGVDLPLRHLVTLDRPVAGLTDELGHGLRNGRSVAEASMGELVRQLEYKTADRSAHLVRVGRFYPSSQTCSRCGARTKLALRQKREQHQRDVASIRGETRNGEPRSGETEPAQHHRAGGHRSFEAATDPATRTSVLVA